MGAHRRDSQSYGLGLVLEGLTVRHIIPLGQCMKEEGGGFAQAQCRGLPGASLLTAAGVSSVRCGKELSNQWRNSYSGTSTPGSL